MNTTTKDKKTVMAIGRIINGKIYYKAEKPERKEKDEDIERKGEIDETFE